MRTFYIVVTFQAGGTRYDLSYSSRVTTTQLHSAVATAIKETKAHYGKRFRVEQGASFKITVVAGHPTSKGEEDGS